VESGCKLIPLQNCCVFHTQQTMKYSKLLGFLESVSLEFNQITNSSLCKALKIVSNKVCLKKKRGVQKERPDSPKTEPSFKTTKFVFVFVLGGGFVCHFETNLWFWGPSIILQIGNCHTLTHTRQMWGFVIHFLKHISNISQHCHTLHQTCSKRGT